jgi:hypothetical protein
MVTNDDNDKVAVNNNIQKARKMWGEICRLVSQEKRKYIKIAVSVYKAIIQAILLYGSETWVVPRATLNNLEMFHKQCARFLTGQY